MPEHCPLEEHFLLPTHEIAYEAAQVGVLEKAQIDRGRVRVRHDLDFEIRWRQLASSNSAVLSDILGIVEDTLFWRGTGLQNTRRCILLEVAEIVSGVELCRLIRTASIFKEMNGSLSPYVDDILAGK